MSLSARIQHDFDPRSQRLGVASMAASCLLFSAQSGLIFHASIVQPTISPLVCSFVRITTNLILIVVPSIVTMNFLELFGDRRPELLLRGVFGALALMSGFSALHAIGVGDAAFLMSSSSIFIALLSPVLLRQRVLLRNWWAIIGATAGLFLLLEPRLGDAHPWGRALAICSGLSSAFAYLMIARAGRTNSARSVIFSFCAVAVVVHLVTFAFVPTRWPDTVNLWMELILAGGLGSLGQICLTYAYQRANAPINAAVSYLGPVFSMLIGMVFFGKSPDAAGWGGIILILGFGIALPLLPSGRIKRPSGA